MYEIETTDPQTLVPMKPTKPSSTEPDRWSWIAVLAVLLVNAYCPAAWASEAPIPWSEIGARAEAQYEGDGLAILATGEGALLRCVFQKLEAEATSEGLWLTSTVPGAATDR
jgi:hypothetical protein